MITTLIVAITITAAVVASVYALASLLDQWPASLTDTQRDRHEESSSELPQDREVDRAGEPVSLSPEAGPAATVVTERKRCPRCRVERPLVMFAVDRSKNSGRKSHCIVCDNARRRAYYRQGRNAS